MGLIRRNNTFLKIFLFSSFGKSNSKAEMGSTFLGWSFIVFILFLFFNVISPFQYSFFRISKAHYFHFCILLFLSPLLILFLRNSLFIY